MANRDNRGVTFERVEFLGENDTVYESRLNLRIVAKAILSRSVQLRGEARFSFLDEAPFPSRNGEARKFVVAYFSKYRSTLERQPFPSREIIFRADER